MRPSSATKYISINSYNQPPMTVTTMPDHAEPGRTAAADRQDDAAIVFFDGVCGLCNRFIDFLMRHDRHRHLHYAPLQGETAQQRLPAELRGSVDSVVFLKNEEMWTRSTAVVHILIEVGGVWGLLGRVIGLVPKFLRDPGYRLVAHWRYRLFGKKESCRMPQGDERDLLLP